MLSHSAIIFAIYLAVGFICSSTFSFEYLYAQEDTPEVGSRPDGELSRGDLNSAGGNVGGLSVENECPEGYVLEDDGCVIPDVDSSGGGCPPDFYESNGECFRYEGECPPDYVLQGEECILESVPSGGGVISDVKEIVEDPVNEITGSVENTISSINPNIPGSTLMIVGVVAVIAIGAGVASFSRHHHGRSSTSHSAQDQTQQDDTEDEQIYEDVQIVTQGGIEEV